MKFDYLKENKEIVSIALFVASAVFVIVILFEVGGYFLVPAAAESLVKRFIAESTSDTNEVKEYLAKSKAVADELKKKNLFAPPVKKQHPVSVVLGIFGSEALINGNWYKAGDKVGDAKIVSVGPTKVTIEWQGSEKVFAPISAIIASSPTERRPEPKKSVVKERVKPKKAAVDKPKKLKEKVANAFGEGDQLGWMGVELSEKARKMIMKQWKKASYVLKAVDKKVCNRMHMEKKRQAIEQMERMGE